MSIYDDAEDAHVRGLEDAYELDLAARDEARFSEEPMLVGIEALVWDGFCYAVTHGTPLDVAAAFACRILTEA